MIGDTDAGFALNAFNIGALTTHSNAPYSNTAGTIQYWSDTYPAYPFVYTYPTNLPPQSCADDVHVFPCPHCDKCKCGAATVKRAKAKK